MSLLPFGVPPLPPQTGNSGKYLTTNGSVPSWAAVAAGGQTLYEAIVAPSGGNYTTVGAAVAAGATRIFVRNGTYTESSGIAMGTANTIIVGESMEGVILTIPSGQQLACNNNFCTVANLRITGSSSGTYGVEFDSDNCNLINVHMVITSGTSRMLVVKGNYFEMYGCFLECTTNASGNIVKFDNGFSGVQPRIVNNRFRFNSGNTGACFFSQMPDTVFVGNIVDISAGNSGAQTATQFSDQATVTGNLFRTNQTTGQIAMNFGGSGVISGNSFRGWATAINLGAIGANVVSNDFLTSTIAINDTGANNRQSGNYGVATIDVVAKVATYTAKTTDRYITADASGGAFTVNLPAVSGNTGVVLTVKKIDSSVNAVTIDGNASETIDGSTTYALSLQWKYAEVTCNGSAWIITANN